MQIFKVGGAVRDQLLGRAVVDIDWVVVGSTPEQMRAQGFGKRLVVLERMRICGLHGFFSGMRLLACTKSVASRYRSHSGSFSGRQTE